MYNTHCPLTEEEKEELANAASLIGALIYNYCGFGRQWHEGAPALWAANDALKDLCYIADCEIA